MRIAILNTFSRPPRKLYHQHVSWPEGLPNNPLLPLALVNRTFRQCAQEILFKNVDLHNTRTANVFLKSLTCGSSKRRKQCNNHPPSRLSQYVRSLQFSWGYSRSPGKRGASLFCKILHNCPLLENIYISNQFLLTCKEPVLEVLASIPFIKELVLINSTDHARVTFQWPPHEIVSRLFSHWNFLETVEFSQLSGWSQHDPSRQPTPNSIPVLNCAIQTMILRDYDLDEQALSNLLRSCGESMRTLEITGPHFHLNPDAFGRILRDSTSPNLECLIVSPPMYWKHTVRDIDLDNETFTSPGLLDTVFDSPTALRNLKTLSFHGAQIASDRLLAHLPKSLIKLSMERCRIAASPLIKVLVISSGHDEAPLPNLMCVSICSPRKWSKKDEINVREVVEMRGGCFHLLRERFFRSPSPTDSDRSRFDPFADSGEDDGW
ncbi:hypothetical protein PCASD_02941 [Puccinia coronata f. sp. avenae]|uniref:F-box domain-containing protein n=1 Tax=Puccinia coronata f. sp. avenae TaxID=200324 RepID=A0A2N5VEG6_9BASI|nr:hypothetical protein PCASD_24153 [Puccinia coronata f. sp. avenae]PLW48380.1 hypothetical protein PCASD_02941 [Puccinia coronata f. sp. avenae]